jgi:hypothetical protein
MRAAAVVSGSDSDRGRREAAGTECVGSLAGQYGTDGGRQAETAAAMVNNPRHNAPRCVCGSAYERPGRPSECARVRASEWKNVREEGSARVWIKRQAGRQIGGGPEKERDSQTERARAPESERGC